jgi:dTDP-4-dehydrorhamnose reductase
MKILITGGSGYLGRHLTAKAANRFEVYTTYSSQPTQIKAGQALPLTLTAHDNVLRLVNQLEPAAIIHTAALNPGMGTDEEMIQVNALGSRYVAEAATAIGARLVYVSTDVVHSGRNAPYTDDAPPAPLNGYGRSKAQAEAAVAQVDPSAAIVRTSLIYGLEEMDRGTEGFVNRLKDGQPLVLFSDVIRQPVWVDSLAAALLRLIEVDYAGTLNVAGRQALTREEFGRRMLAWWGIEPGNLLQAGLAADIAPVTPLDLRLTITKAEQLLQMTLPGVDEVLSQATGNE